MKRIPDSARLGDLSVPGSHDSGASVRGGDMVLNQSMSLKDQLRSGIRAWDIRLGNNGDDRLAVYHGFVRQGQDFEKDVLTIASAFLDAHPSETILMRVKHEHGFLEGFDHLVKESTDKFDRIYRGNDRNPRMADMRGKIVILQNFGSYMNFGIYWITLTIQDEYTMAHNWALADKWGWIKSRLNYAATEKEEAIHVNFLSASGGSFPYFVASGKSSPGTNDPQLRTGMTRGVIDTCSGSSVCLNEYPSIDCLLGTCSVVFKGTNQLALEEISRRKGPTRYGLIYADFPGGALINEIIRSNFS